MCYYGGKEMGQITSGRQLLQYAKLEESINHVPHPSYLPPALLRIWVDLNGSGSIWVDLGPRGATNRKRFHRESICEVMNCETSMCMLDLIIVCQAQGFLRNNIGTSPANSFSLWKRNTVSKGEKEPSSFFRNVKCFFTYNIDGFTLRREKSLCRMAATPNHYVRSAFQGSRRVSKGEKEDANVL